MINAHKMLISCVEFKSRKYNTNL